ncbi:MAG TPA: aspartate kinase [Longimicrobiales bacterium]|nr:aspartate kinase [Longimicrobiales bacterium]
MSLLVQKYGGTSVGDPARIRRVAERVCRFRRAGHDIVVVVSAMGDTTDELERLAGAVSSAPGKRHPREMDMLLTAGERISMALVAMAIREAGEEAISFTGSQAAIITDGTHTGARIEEVRGERVREELDRGRVVIVAGFQGVSRMREVTTLGRGGSDTTAVALAAALGAERCDIFTDVDGVHTADPRKVPTARTIRHVDYEEMMELAVSGAQVMHPRAVEIGARFGVPIRVLSSLVEGEEGGTLIARRERTMEDPALTAVASERSWAQLVLRGVPPEMMTMTTVLTRLSGAGVSVDLLTQVDRADGRRLIQLTVSEAELEEARSTCEAVVRELGGERVDVETGLARLALVGSGMHKRPGVFARVFETLRAEGVAVHSVSASSTSIILMVGEADEERAVRLLHDAFDLGGSG